MLEKTEGSLLHHYITTDRINKRTIQCTVRRGPCICMQCNTLFCKVNVSFVFCCRVPRYVVPSYPEVINQMLAPSSSRLLLSILVYPDIQVFFLSITDIFVYTTQRGVVIFGVIGIFCS